MDSNAATPGMDDLDCDNDTDAFSPSTARLEEPKLDEADHSLQATEQQSRRLEEREVNDEEARCVALRRELAGVRNINQVIEGVINGLERAGDNMNVRHHGLPLMPFNLCDMRLRQSLAPWLMPRPCSALGRGSCRKPNTTNG